MENIFDTVIYLRMGKTFKAKTPPGEFKVTTLENPLLSKQAVTLPKKRPIAAGAKPAAICRLLRRVLALPLNMDLLRRDNRPATIVLVYCGVLLWRANDPP